MPLLASRGPGNKDQAGSWRGSRHVTLCVANVMEAFAAVCQACCRHGGTSPAYLHNVCEASAWAAVGLDHSYVREGDPHQGFADEEGQPQQTNHQRRVTTGSGTLAVSFGPGKAMEAQRCGQAASRCMSTTEGWNSAGNRCCR